MLTRNALVTLVVGGVSYGVWISKSGGQLEADGQKTRLGGMSPQIALGGPASRENITLHRLFDEYMQSKYHTLDAQVGTGSASATYTPLNNGKAASGPSITVNGVLIRVTPPDADDNAAELAFIELEISAHEVIG